MTEDGRACDANFYEECAYPGPGESARGDTLVVVPGDRSGFPAVDRRSKCPDFPHRRHPVSSFQFVQTSRVTVTLVVTAANRDACRPRQ